jgi:hypothetical protein
MPGCLCSTPRSAETAARCGPQKGTAPLQVSEPAQPHQAPSVCAAPPAARTAKRRLETRKGAFYHARRTWRDRTRARSTCAVVSGVGGRACSWCIVSIPHHANSQIVDLVVIPALEVEEPTTGSECGLHRRRGGRQHTFSRLSSGCGRCPRGFPPGSPWRRCCL